MSAVGAADPWASAGSYFDPSSGSGYISNGELMAWLAHVTGDKWGELRGEMMTTDARHELMEDLGHLKTEFDKAADTQDVSTLRQTVADLQAKYEGTSEQAKVDELCRGFLSEIEKTEAANARLKEANGPFEAVEAMEEVQAQRARLLGQLETWSEDVQNKVDRLGRDDQLGLIRIQELQSNISQSVSTASNLIKNDDQAKTAIIMNMKG